MSGAEGAEDEDLALIPLSDPDISALEIARVEEALRGAVLYGDALVRDFERAFAAYTGRKFAIATSTGGAAMQIALRACGVAAGDEVIASSYGYRELAHAILNVGALPRFAEIDYWAGTLAPSKMAAMVSPATRALVVGNSNGHPAAWAEIEEFARERGLVLIEDSSEAIGSRYKGRRVGSFGACSVFELSQPLALTCGEGGMIVTDDIDVAMNMRRLRGRSLEDRGSVVIGSTAPMQAQMSNLAAALGLAQLERLDEILARRRACADFYLQQMKSFEGIKDPYVAPDVTEINWFLYVVHLGTRFSRSSRDAIIDDLRVENVQAAAYSSPLHLQRRYFDIGCRHGDLFVTEKVADRAVALPLHTHLKPGHIEFIVETMKDASVNVGAGAAIY